MNTFELKSLGLAIAEADLNDRRAVVANAMSRGRTGASTSNVLRVVTGWSSVLNKGIGIENLESLPDADTAQQSEAVLGPSEHTEYIDEAVLAYAQDVNYPKAKVTNLRKCKSQGVTNRCLDLNGTTYTFGPLDWASILAVVTGKAPKNVACGLSFGKAGSEDVVRIRDTRSSAVGEIAVKALLKLA